MHSLSTHSHLYLSVASASPTVASCVLRKELLRKTQKDLIKQCKEYKLCTAGSKGDIVDRIIKHQTNPSQRIQHKRRSTISETLTTKRILKKKRTSSLIVSSAKTPKITSISSKTSTKSVKPKTTKINTRCRSQSEASLKKQRKKKSSKIVSTYLDHVDEKQNVQNTQKQPLLTWFNNKFNDDTKYDKLKEIIKRYDIKYNELNEITDLTLKILDINDESNRKLIMNEIANITKSQQIKSAPMTKKEKQYETEINRLRRQISRQKQEYADLKKKYDKLSKTATVKSPKGKAWKSSYHAPSNKTPKSKTPKKSEISPKLKNGASETVVNLKKKKKKKKRKNGELELGAPRELKRKASRRYDEGFGIKIAGLSALNLFIEEYEQKKQEKEKPEKQSEESGDCKQSDTKILSLDAKLLGSNDENDDNGNCSTDDDFVD